MSPASQNDRLGRDGRVSWIDLAKGLSIILVVQMHSTLGLEAALGVKTFAGDIVEFARSFRMPLFFLVAGLFLSRTITKGWREFADKKVVHFFYFYVLWLTIQFGFKAGHLSGGDPVELARLYLIAFVEPFGTLWFIYLLPIFFVTTKLLARVDVRILWAGAALLSALPIHTGWIAVDEFASRYVFFVTGYIASNHVFRWAETAADKPVLAASVVSAFLAINLACVSFGANSLPGAGLLLGLFGAFAIIGGLSAIAHFDWAGILRFCGRQSLVIYLAFFLPMVISRIVLLKLQPHLPLDANLMALMITLSAIIGPLLMHWIAVRVGARFLFERPGWAHVPSLTVPVKVDREQHVQTQ